MSLKIELENEIDRHGLAHILEILVEIAGEKSEHIAVNWQDNKTAVQWHRCAITIEKAAAIVRERLGQ